MPDNYRVQNVLVARAIQDLSYTAIMKHLRKARAIFQEWFIDYEPFGGAAPLDWHPSTLGQIAEMKTDSWSPAKNPDVELRMYLLLLIPDAISNTG